MAELKTNMTMREVQSLENFKMESINGYFINMVEYKFQKELFDIGFNMKIPIAQHYSIDGYLVFTQEDRWNCSDERENEIALEREKKEFERVLSDYPYMFAFH